MRLLLVGHCKYCSILYHFRVFLTVNNIVILRSLEVIEIGAIQKLGCGFLFAFYSNYGRICSRL